MLNFFDLDSESLKQVPHRHSSFRYSCVDVNLLALKLRIDVMFERATRCTSSLNSFAIYTILLSNCPIRSLDRRKLLRMLVCVRPISTPLR